MDSEQKAVDLLDHYLKVKNIQQCHSLIRYYKTQADIFFYKGNKQEYEKYRKIVNVLEKKLSK
jgi:hypothetical protein